MSYIDPKTGEVSGRNNPPKKNDGTNLKHKITNVFIKNDGFSVRVKPIPTTILVLGFSNLEPLEG